MADLAETRAEAGGAERSTPRRQASGTGTARHAWLVVCALALSTRGEIAAAELHGQVTVAGVPVPGATITATQGDRRVITVSDAQGVYTLADLGDGAWTVRVEMVGFATMSRDITIPADGPPPAWELTLLPFAEISRSMPPPVTQPAQPVAPPSPETSPPRGLGGGGRQSPRGAPAQGAPASAGQGGFQRAGVNAAVAPPTATGSPFAGGVADGVPDEDAGGGAADGFLINGSVNNGASSPFAQARAFGNARPGQRSLYNGGVALLWNNSAWDSRPFSFTSDQAPKPSYNDVQFNGTFGGPLRIPRLPRNGANVFVGYQRSRDHNATTQPALVPTPLERDGDLSQSRDPLGRPAQPVDPLTGRPFPGNVIPRDRISPQAAALLGYYPRPNISGAEGGAGGYNYQAPIVVASQQDSVQTRLSHNLNNRDQLVGTVAYNRSATDAANLFGFMDSTRVANVDTGLNWSHRLSQFLFLRTRYQFTQAWADVTPHFANRNNVSGLAGIAGNNQDPVNWGPPALTFSSGIEGLSSAQFADNSNHMHGWTGETFWNHGRHSFTFGGNLRRQNYDVLSQQNARGAFGFTGAAAGSDMADFLLGLPQTSAIAFGNADKALRQSMSEAYANDDWRVSASLTLNLGLRWEYESPITEAQGRLVNLDVAPGFAAVSPVLAGTPVGATTGQTFSNALVHPDRRGVEPRLGVAWRPVPGSSLVVRGGYGIYRNMGVYQSIALLMAQQPPLSTTASVQSSADRPLTLANGFIRAGAAAGAGATAATDGSTSTAVLNTFAVDPNFRMSYAENWQTSVQRDLPASLTVIGTYLGSRGHRLMQEFLPNTYPTGATNPCAACPSGFVYLASNGTSLRNAGQVQVRRRLRNGFTASAQYTLARATDNAAAFGAVGLGGSSIAQDWLDIDADHGPSNFDQRHNLVALAQYTTGAGVTGGTLVDGVKGRLLKDWTFVTQLTTGSGLPLTPVSLAPVGSTGVTGSIRATLTGVSLDAVPEGYYLNPAAYTAPAAGQWGNAGRNSIKGPAQFSLNAAVGRTFRWGERLNLDWRFDATNVLNRITYLGVNMLVASPQFGLPNRASQMRKLQSSVRLRF